MTDPIAEAAALLRANGWTVKDPEKSAMDQLGSEILSIPGVKEVSISTERDHVGELGSIRVVGSARFPFLEIASAVHRILEKHAKYKRLFLTGMVLN